VFCGDISVATVYPPEAKANGVNEQSVAKTWADNLKKALPRATPPSKLGGTAAPKAPKAPVSAPPELPGADTGRGRTGGVVPVAAVPAETAPTEVETPAPTTTIAAPTLLVRDAFDTIRKLPEEEYRGKRDEIVQHLIADLTPFITGQVPSSTAGPAVPRVPTAAGGTGPTVDRPGPTGPSGANAPKPTATGDTTPKPAVTGGAPKPSVLPGPAARNLPKTRAGDPNYAKVPQKNRIRTKLEMAREPSTALRQEDPAAAQPIDEMLAKARNAYYKGEYDEAEDLVDTALALLGLEYTE